MQPYSIAFIVLFLLLLAFLIYTCVGIKKDGVKIAAQSLDNNVRIFSIYYEEARVYAVDKGDLSHPREESLDWFYDSFIPEDKIRLKAWLRELKKEKHIVPHHLEVHVKTKSTKQSIFSVLSVTSINYDKKVIHIESRLFPNLKKVKKTKNSKVYIKHYNEMTDLYAKNNSSVKTLYLIRLYSTNELESGSTRISHMIITFIISRLVKFLSSSRYMCLLKSNEIIILDYKLSTKNEAIAFGHNISNEISKSLFLNSSIDEYAYKIGVIQEKKTNVAFTTLIKKAREMSIYAEKNKLGTNIMMYDPDLSFQQENETSIIDDIKNTIEKNDFICKYTPILSCQNGKVVGYDCDLSAPNSLINSIPDMQDYAAHNELLVQLDTALYSTVKSIIPQLKGNTKYYLTMDLKFSHYKTFIDIFKNNDIKIKNVNTIFIIKETDLLNEVNKNLSIISELKENNMIIALELTSTSLDIVPELLKLFDYFIIREDSLSNVLSSQNMILFGDMLSRLSSYKGKIIGLDVTNWSMVDLFSRNNIQFISSSIFGQEDNKLPKIDLKKINKFKQITTDGN